MSKVVVLVESNEIDQTLLYDSVKSWLERAQLTEHQADTDEVHQEEVDVTVINGDIAGQSSTEARLAHNQKVARSNRAGRANLLTKVK